MDQVDVVAVIGTCSPERARCAAQIADETGRGLVPASRLELSHDPAAEALALVPWAHGPAGVVVELPPAIPPTEIIGRFTHPASGARLMGLTCIVDAPHLLDDIARDDYLVRVGHGGRLFRARALATVTQIEYASTVVLVNWDALSTPDLSTILAVVSALSPRARIRLRPAPFDAPESPHAYEALQDRPGWLALLNDEHEPHMTDPRVTSLRYQAMRPFHPERLEHLLDERIERREFGVLLRSSGFCRLATRPGVTAHWEHVGSMLSMPPATRDDQLSDDELLAAGQDIALIGLDLDAPALVRAFDAATLADDEFAAGPAAWAEYADPFPRWART